MGIDCLKFVAFETDFGISGKSPDFGSEHFLLDHMDLMYAKLKEFGSAYEMVLKEYHRMRIGCLALEAVEDDFGILRQNSNLGSEHSLLYHIDSV